MARGVNKVILIGNLGQQPEIKYSSSGVAVGNISIATSEARKDKTSGEWLEHTEWHRVVLLGRLAEVAGEYLNKGSKIYLEGRLQTRQWQDNAGQNRYTTEIVANDLQMLDAKPVGQPAVPEPARSPRRSGPPVKPTKPAMATADDGPPFDDDVPF